MKVKPNQLHLGDCLDIFKNWDDESVDLIYADPPFYSNADYYTKDGEFAFSDKWDSLEEYAASIAIRLWEMRRLLKPTGSIFIHCDQNASARMRMNLDYSFGRKNFRNEIIWTYPPTGQIPKRGFPRKHDNILFYAKSANNYFNPQYTPMRESTLNTYSYTDEEGRKYSKAHGGRTYLDEVKGRAVPDWWDDIGAGSHMPKAERTGYPTQKPIKLLKRIINASTPPNGLVLDPYCGSGSTLKAAQELGRQWIGIDKSPIALKIAEERLGQR